MRCFLISWWFPPLNVIGAARTYRIASALAKEGIEVVVFCTCGSSRRGTFDVDESQFTKISIEQSAFVRMLEPNPRGESRVSRIIKAALRRFCFPDVPSICKRKWLSAIEREVSDSGKPDFVVSSALPFFCHVIASHTVSRYNVPWVADNRDLWASSHYRKRSFVMRAVDKYYEKKILCSASRLVTVGEGMRHNLGKVLNRPEDTYVVYNSADEPEDFEPLPPKDSVIRLVYTGILYGHKRDLSPLFDAISNCKDLNVEFTFYGAETRMVEHYMQKYPDLKIAFHGRVSKKQIKEIQRAATALVLALGTDPFEKTVLTGKFFEYLEAGRPVIGVCSEDTELAAIVERHDLGCASREVEVLKSFVERLAVEDIDVRCPVELSTAYQMGKFLGIVRSLS